MKCAQEMIFSTVSHDDNLEFLIIDDTVCKKYGTQSEMVCYNHSTVLGTVLSHDYVTGFYLCGDVCLPSSSARLYGNPKKCNEKGIPFRTKIQLCNEIIDEHRPIARKTVTLIDSWYTGNEVISNCRKRGYGWIGDLKPNRVIFYDGKRMNVSDLMDSLRRRGQLTDTVIDGQIYQTVKVMAYIPSLKKNVSIVINAKADTKEYGTIYKTICTFARFVIRNPQGGGIWKLISKEGMLEQDGEFPKCQMRLCNHQPITGLVILSPDIQTTFLQALKVIH